MEWQGKGGKDGRAGRLGSARTATTLVRMSLVLAMLCAGAASAVHAQTGAGSPLVASVGSGWGRLWDDETNLGRGAPLAGGVAVLLGGKIRVGGDVDWTSHVRDSGYLRTEGDLFGAFTRAAYMFGTDDSRFRPLVGAGLGVLRSTGTLITRSTLLGQNGLPVAGPEERRPWALTRSAFDLHAGIQWQLSERFAVRPEARWRATFGSAASPSIEPPLIGIQTMVLLDSGL